MDAGAPRHTRRTELWVGLGLLAAAVALGAWIFFVRGNAPFAVDAWWNTLLAQGRHGFLLHLSYAMNWLGGAWFGILGMPVILICVLLLLRRPWSAAYFVVAVVASALVVQLLKHSFGRARPEDIAVVSDYGSFPSGHVANATTIVVVLFVIFPRLWVALVGAAWVLVMAFSRTYLGAHWLSDTLGGALAGASAAILVAAAFGALVTRERGIGPRRLESRRRLQP